MNKQRNLSDDEAIGLIKEVFELEDANSQQSEMGSKE